MKLPDFSLIEGFEWDNGNIDKNWIKHKVKPGEIEEIFFNEPILIAHDENHSEREVRFAALGITNSSRRLFAVFTVRNNKIRIISVRDMSKKERKVYENYQKENP
ncbi:BrnT family toxin [Leptospira ilyithenensis]|nr:BrnT family toxin [Leptospira ilyithenensis]